jgi:hypothetical protein
MRLKKEIAVIAFFGSIIYRNEGSMRFAKFWRMQVSDLSLTERMFYRDAIRTLQAWDTLKEEFAELELIRKILESEINVPSVNPPEEEASAILGDLYIEEDSLVPFHETL